MRASPILALAAEPPLSEETGERWLHDGRTVLRRVCVLPGGETQRRRFALAVGPNQEAAEQAAQRTLAMPPDRACALPAQLASQLDLNSAALAESMDMVGALMAGSLPDAPARLRRRDALWALGVSGDLPILPADFAPAEHSRRAAESGDDALGVFCLHERGFQLILLAGLRVQRTDLGDLLLQEG